MKDIMNDLDEVKKVLVVGATGATGRRLVKQLLGRGLHVKAIVRASAILPSQLDAHDRLTVIRADLLALTDSELETLTAGCQSIASCLGHNMSWRGVFGEPRRLVTDTVRRLSNAIVAGRPHTPVRLVLMNSAACRNRDIDEPLPRAQRLVVAMLRLLVPPHADNEQAAEYLRENPGRTNTTLEWVVVRPDSLTDEATVTDYSIHPSPTRSAIFDPGATSRINVAHLMADLITDDRLWHQWEGQMPVVYNTA
jgi:nucleoside-diphosphate-sugar epimerase